MEQVESFYKTLNTGHSPMIDEWTLMKSPMPMLGILAAYLYFVLRSGPKMMRDRKPVDLKWILILYNASQVVFSVWLCMMAFANKDVALQVFTLGCRSNVTVTAPMYLALYTGAYWYYIAKIIELLDTVFFVLRKNQHQVTFLHVYHHTVMVMWAFYYLKYAFGEQGVAVGFMNSFVHVIMYSYYLLAAIGPQMKKFLWWKKYLTALQLIQFCTMIVVLAVTSIMDCNVPKQVTLILSFLVISFLYLFSRFYIKSYQKPVEPKKTIGTEAVDATMATEKKSFDSNNNVNLATLKKIK